MSKLTTFDPDSGAEIPLSVEGPVLVTGVKIFRGDVEGDRNALNALVHFELSHPLPEEGREHMLHVFIEAQTEGHLVRMMAYGPVHSIDELRQPWDFATVANGVGSLRSVHVRTELAAPDTF